jgi:two-component system response regulator AtoC
MTLGALLGPADGRINLETDSTDLPDSVLFGRSPLMREVRHKVERVAGANVPVLIRGESGTGKELIARLIHARAPWARGSFVKVNCPTLPGTPAESELFGYAGANRTKLGRVEMAQKGTLFLDEIAELQAGLQARLLQLLQDGQFCPIIGPEDQRIDARVICATNRDLEDQIRRGNFRQDLFYRINVVSIYMPSLRERREDIPIISDTLRLMYGERFARPTKAISARKLEMMQQYHWPGNIRELENSLKGYVILGSEDAIHTEGGRREANFAVEAATDNTLSFSLKKVTREAVRALESKIIVKTLQAHNGNRRRAASALDISYRALLYKIKEAGLTTRKGSKTLHSAGIGDD